MAKRRYEMTARAAKTEKTRARIRMSAIQLYQERAAIEAFTVEEVAQRAGVAVRTILRAWRSKEELVCAALDSVAEQHVVLPRTPPGDVAAAVCAFFDVYESIGDLAMQRLNDERHRPALKPALDQGRENHREGVNTAFAPHLDRFQGEQRAQLLTILVIATDVYVWKLLRRDMAFSRAASEAIVVQIINGVISRQEQPRRRVNPTRGNPPPGHRAAESDAPR
jgi:AcrR family transcriptional regulator